MRLWDVSSGKELKHQGYDDKRSLNVSLCTDGKLIFAERYNKTLVLSDIYTDKEVQRLNHGAEILYVVFSRDCKLIATASDEKTVRLWEVSSGRELESLDHNGPVNVVEFSPDGKLVATTSSGNTARLWKVGSGNELKRLSHDGNINAMFFSHDGKIIATSSYDKTVRLWEVSSGKEQKRLSHDSSVNFIAFSPDDKVIATASYDNKVRLWDVSSGMELELLSQDDLVNALIFSPDGQRLATKSTDNTVRLWSGQPHREDLISQLCTRLDRNLTWKEWQDYFKNIAYRKTCEKLPIAQDFQQKWKILIRDGEKTKAENMIKQLNLADPALKLDQEQMLQKWKASLRLVEAEQKLLKNKKITEAIAVFDQVDQLDSKLISANSWNNLCWQGTLNDHPEQVLNACEKAVRAATAEERWKYQDNRGLARALTGNSQGAIEDFEFVINTGNEKLKKQRQAWVQALRAGQNPFTKEELAKLR